MGLFKKKVGMLDTYSDDKPKTPFLKTLGRGVGIVARDIGRGAAFVGKGVASYEKKHYKGQLKTAKNVVNKLADNIQAADKGKKKLPKAYTPPPVRLGWGKV